jgi:hypothetical protein
MSMTYSEFVSVAVVIQHAVRMRHIVICGLPRFCNIFHIISQTERFPEKNYWTWNVCFDVRCNFCLETFLIPKKNWARCDKSVYIGLRAQYRFFIFRFYAKFSKNIEIPFAENPFSGRRVVPSARKEGQADWLMDLMEPIVAFRNFANAPKQLHCQNCTTFSFYSLTSHN